MQYTVDEILSVRHTYTEPPFPGFSLEEVVRRRRLAQTKLVRGENAWQAKPVAETTEEWVTRLLHRCLNKLSERNYTTQVAELKTKEIFSTTEILNSVANLIFRKALDEPENSRLYAGVCYELAMYEVSLGNHDASRPQSEIRDIIISVAQREFQVYRQDDTIVAEDATDEEREFIRASFMRRKRANMRFVGELYLKNVLTHATMLNIMDVTMKLAEEGGVPDCENIELIAELMRTVGERLDKQQKKAVDHHFGLLAKLVQGASSPYPHRIRFKILDLLDFRAAGWRVKPKAPAKPAPVTHSTAGAGKKAKPATSAASPTAANKMAKSFGDALRGSSKSWKEVANPKVSGNTAAAAAGKKGNVQDTTSEPTSPGATGSSSSAAVASASPNEAAVPFELRVKSMYMEWAQQRSNAFVPSWRDDLLQTDRTFTSNKEMSAEVALEVLKDACMTTRANAQREAYSFLVVGLDLTDEELLDGFVRAAAAAFEDGLLEDVPKFSERFMNILRLTSTEELLSVDVYYDAANVLRQAYNRIDEPDEFTVEALMEFWKKVPVQSADEAEEEKVVVNFTVLSTLCVAEEFKAGEERLIAAIIRSMETMGIVEPQTIAEMLEYQCDNELYRRIVDSYRTGVKAA